MCRWILDHCHQGLKWLEENGWQHFVSDHFVSYTGYKMNKSILQKGVMEAMLAERAQCLVHLGNELMKYEFKPKYEWNSRSINE